MRPNSRSPARLTGYRFEVARRTFTPWIRPSPAVRLRRRRAKGSGSRAPCLDMVYLLMLSASKRWGSLNGSS
jgi:hypothetical protein